MNNVNAYSFITSNFLLLLGLQLGESYPCVSYLLNCATVPITHRKLVRPPRRHRLVTDFDARCPYRRSTPLHNAIKAQSLLQRM